MWIII